MPHRAWTLLGSRQIAEYKILRLREDRYRVEPTREEADFVVCDSNDWALVIPLTRDGQVVFVHQYRHGVQEVVLEIPGGLLDDGESAEAAAARELREETGFAAARVRYLGRLLPNPALNTAACHICVAEDCVPVGDQLPDPLERIDVILRPVGEVPAMIRSGELCHAQVVAAFALLGTLPLAVP
jgi:8-oxo-dGTP pyrophosphatase MutT (NUDIX family)